MLDVGFDDHLHKLSVGHDELWQQIDVPVSIMPEFLWLFFPWLEMVPDFS
jgi:hypothetical protein